MSAWKPVSVNNLPKTTISLAFFSGTLITTNMYSRQSCEIRNILSAAPQLLPWNPCLTFRVVISVLPCSTPLLATSSPHPFILPLAWTRSHMCFRPETQKVPSVYFLLFLLSTHLCPDLFWVRLSCNTCLELNPQQETDDLPRAGGKRSILCLAQAIVVEWMEALKLPWYKETLWVPSHLIPSYYPEHHSLIQQLSAQLAWGRAAPCYSKCGQN